MSVDDVEHMLPTSFLRPVASVAAVDHLISPAFRSSSRVVNGVFLFKSLLKNADPRGCEGRQNALFVRADRFVLYASSALVGGGRDLAASPIFRGIGL